MCTSGHGVVFYAVSAPARHAMLVVDIFAMHIRRRRRGGVRVGAVPVQVGEKRPKRRSLC
jgi:hypothetical protein